MYGAEIDHFHHFLTAFGRASGHATPRMHHPRYVGQFFFKLNSLRLGLGIICPNKRSSNEVVPGQTADAVGQTLTSHPPFQPHSGKKSEMKWEIQLKFDWKC
jgi:hypothetical protein